MLILLIARVPVVVAEPPSSIAPVMPEETAAPGIRWAWVKEKFRVAPLYPEAARAKGEEGYCKVLILIEADGVPSSVEPVSCPDDFLASASAAAMASRFYPSEDDGQFVPIRFTYNYRFTLDGASPSQPAPASPASSVVQPREPSIEAEPLADAHAATLVVTATDPADLAMPGTLITVRSDALIGGAQQTTTDDDGRATFTGLPPGEYTVLAQLQGFTAARRKVVLVVAKVVGLKIVLGYSDDDIILDGGPLPFRAAESGRGTWAPRDELDQLPTRSLGGFVAIARHPGLGAGLEGGEIATLDGMPVSLDALPRTAGSLLPGGVRVDQEWPSGAEPGVNVWVDKGGQSTAAFLRSEWTPGGLDTAASVNGPILKDKVWFAGVAESVDGDARIAAGMDAYPANRLRLGIQSFASSTATHSRVDLTAFPNRDISVRATAVYSMRPGGLTGAPDAAEWLGDLHVDAFVGGAKLGRHEMVADVFGAYTLDGLAPLNRVSGSVGDTWEPTDDVSIVPRVGWQWRTGDKGGDPSGRLGLWAGPPDRGGFAVIARRFEGWSDPNAALVRRDEILLGGGFGYFIRLKATAYGALRVDEDGARLPGRADLQLAATCPMGAEPFPGTGLTGSAAATWRPALPGFNDGLPSAEAGALITDSWISTGSATFPGRFVPAVGVGMGAALVDGVIKGQFAARIGLGFDLHRTLLEFGVEGSIGTPAWLTAADQYALGTDSGDSDPATITPLRFSLRVSQ